MSTSICPAASLCSFGALFPELKTQTTITALPRRVSQQTVACDFTVLKSTRIRGLWDLGRLNRTFSVGAQKQPDQQLRVIRQLPDLKTGSVSHLPSSTSLLFCLSFLPFSRFCLTYLFALSPTNLLTSFLVLFLFFLQLFNLIYFHFPLLLFSFSCL